MRRPTFHAATALAAAALLTAACGAVGPAPAGGKAATEARAAAARPLPIKRFTWSRQAQQDGLGFYHQPAALCDDYPEETTTPAKIRRDFATMKAAGVTQLRFAFGWDAIEEEPGTYNWGFWDDLVDEAQRQGITLIPYVCYTPRWLGTSETDYWHEPPSDLAAFGRFMNVIVKRYKGKIKSWELWNEPDLQAYWLGSAAQFAEMVKEGARQVRKADPEAVVVLGGMSNGRGPFFDTIMKRYDVGGYFDVINVHGYHETWHPEVAEAYPERLHGMMELMPKIGPKPDLWLAEFGYSDYRFKPNQVSQWGVDAVYDYEHTPRFQAVALIRHHALALSTGTLGLSAWYRINDLPPSEGVIGDDNNKFLGLLDAQGRRKPAFYAMQTWNRLLDRPTRPIDGALRIAAKAGSQAEVHAFERNDGAVVLAAWLRSSTPDEAGNGSGMAKDKRQERLAVTFPRAYRGLKVVDAEGGARAGGTLEGRTLSEVALAGGDVYLAVLTP